MLDLTITETPEETVLSIAGALDNSASSELDAQINLIITSSHRALVVDLSALSYLNSMGLKSFVRLERKLKVCGKALVLRSVPSHIRRIFEYCGLETYFQFETRKGSLA